MSPFHPLNPLQTSQKFRRHSDQDYFPYKRFLPEIKFPRSSFRIFPHSFVPTLRADFANVFRLLWFCSTKYANNSSRMLIGAQSLVLINLVCWNIKGSKLFSQKLTHCLYSNESASTSLYSWRSPPWSSSSWWWRWSWLSWWSWWSWLSWWSMISWWTSDYRLIPKILDSTGQVGRFSTHLSYYH